MRQDGSVSRGTCVATRCALIMCIFAAASPLAPYRQLSAQEYPPSLGGLPNLARPSAPIAGERGAAVEPSEDDARIAGNRRPRRAPPSIDVNGAPSSRRKDETAVDRNFFRSGMVTDFYGQKQNSRISQEQETFGYYGQEPAGEFDELVDATTSAQRPAASRAQGEKIGQQNLEFAEQQAREEGRELSPTERVLIQYGDPSKPAPVKAVENAPTPFKGMMAALDADNEELAFAYARQWVRYIRDVQDTTRKVVSVSEVAMEREGMSAPSALDDNPYKYLLSNEEGEAAKLIDGGPKPTQLSDKAKDVLAKAQVAENRANLAGTAAEAESKVPEYPSDPKGEVDVYVFIDTKDQGARRTVAITKRAVERRAAGTDLVRLRYFLLNKPSALEIASLRDISGGLPFVDGAALARQFAIKEPTTLLVTRNSGQMVEQKAIKGERSLDEILRQMMARGER